MKKSGSRNTPQREIIYKIILSAPGPLTVYDILEIANNDQQKIGIATVYRTIKLFLEEKKIIDVTLPDGQVRYETPPKEHRHHFHCKVCDMVIDIHHCCLHLHKDEVEGHKVDSHEITLIGTCKKCL